jgi:hypothetical protein
VISFGYGLLRYGTIHTPIADEKLGYIIQCDNALIDDFLDHFSRELQQVDDMKRREYVARNLCVRQGLYHVSSTHQVLSRKPHFELVMTLELEDIKNDE